MLVVLVNVLLVRLPGDVSLHLLFVVLVALAMLGFPGTPFLGEIKGGSCCDQGAENEELHRGRLLVQMIRSCDFVVRGGAQTMVALAHAQVNGSVYRPVLAP